MKHLEKCKPFCKEIILEHLTIISKLNTQLSNILLNRVYGLGYNLFALSLELVLLKKMGYIDEDVHTNILNMVKSKSEYDFNVAVLAITNIRKLRITEHGSMETNPNAYTLISKIYLSEILNLKLLNEFVCNDGRK